MGNIFSGEVSVDVNHRHGYLIPSKIEVDVKHDKLVPDKVTIDHRHGHLIPEKISVKLSSLPSPVSWALFGITFLAVTLGFYFLSLSIEPTLQGWDWIRFYATLGLNRATGLVSHPFEFSILSVILIGIYLVLCNKLEKMWEMKGINQNFENWQNSGFPAEFIFILAFSWQTALNKKYAAIIKRHVKIPLLLCDALEKLELSAQSYHLAKKTRESYESLYANGSSAYKEISVTYASACAKIGKTREAVAILETILKTSEISAALKMKVQILFAFLKLSDKKYRNALELIEEGLALVESNSEEELVLLANKMFALYELGNQTEGKLAIDRIIGSGNHLPVDTRNCAVTWKWLAQKSFKGQFQSLPDAVLNTN